MLVTISKCDMLDDELKAEIVKEFPKNVPVHFLSSMSNVGIFELKDKLWTLLNEDLVEA
jgi:GTP-binding protein